MKHVAVAAIVAVSGVAHAAETTVTMKRAESGGPGASVGTVRIVETQYGLAFYPQLTGLSPGQHGFHVHQNGSCDSAQRDGSPVPALAAGGHLDPRNTNRHGPPWGDGHLGDLPALYVGTDGSADSPVLAPRLKLADVANRALMIHAGGDNYSDQPQPLGGGGARLACGVIDK